MIYYHKNPLFKSMLFVIKFQYRDEKRIKFRGQLIDEKFKPIWNIESYKVNPNFFENYTTKKSESIPDSQDLLILDNDKENYILS